MAPESGIKNPKQNPEEKPITTDDILVGCILQTYESSLPKRSKKFEKPKEQDVPVTPDDVANELVDGLDLFNPDSCDSCKVPDPTPKPKTETPGSWDSVWGKEQKIMGEAKRKYEAGESKYPYVETEFPPKECNYPGQRPAVGDCSSVLWGGAEPHFVQKTDPDLKPEQIYERIKKNLEIVRNATEEIEFLEELMKNYQAKINQKKKEPSDK